MPTPNYQYGASNSGQTIKKIGSLSIPHTYLIDLPDIDSRFTKILDSEGQLTVVCETAIVLTKSSGQLLHPGEIEWVGQTPVHF